MFGWRDSTQQAIQLHVGGCGAFILVEREEARPRSWKPLRPLAADFVCHAYIPITFLVVEKGLGVASAALALVEHLLYVPLPGARSRLHRSRIACWRCGKRSRSQRLNVQRNLLHDTRMYTQVMLRFGEFEAESTQKDGDVTNATAILRMGEAHSLGRRAVLSRHTVAVFFLWGMEVDVRYPLFRCLENDDTQKLRWCGK